MPTLCEHLHLTDEERSLFDSRGLPTSGIVKGKGCSNCNSTGYKGRMAIHEIVLMDDQLREMITKKQADSTYRQYVGRAGF